jgi:hypothetical protein
MQCKLSGATRYGYTACLARSDENVALQHHDAVGDIGVVLVLVWLAAGARLGVVVWSKAGSLSYLYVDAVCIVLLSL